MQNAILCRLHGGLETVLQSIHFYSSIDSIKTCLYTLIFISNIAVFVLQYLLGCEGTIVLVLRILKVLYW